MVPVRKMSVTFYCIGFAAWVSFRVKAPNIFNFLSLFRFLQATNHWDISYSVKYKPHTDTTTHREWLYPKRFYNVSWESNTINRESRQTLILGCGVIWDLTPDLVIHRVKSGSLDILSLVASYLHSFPSPNIKHFIFENHLIL